ncbi:hypothetical protein IWW37_004826 [Coemansia sp. RSA 2050]|nr:hypothetical protein IWW37_004826 [Coemansia sp. RSA 2050]KAJ2730071.1 hypothetical protein IW152_005400 [Coemansia sp. BCRC 34962]
MAFRKRSLDLPVSEDSPSSIKHPRSGSRPPLAAAAAQEPTAPASDYNGGALPPIRSLTGLALGSPGFPSFRHFHTSSGASNSPASSVTRPESEQASGLTAGLSQLSHTRAAPTPQPPYAGPSCNPPPAHYTHAPPPPPPLPPLPLPPPPPPHAHLQSYYRSPAEQAALGHASSPMSSSDRSPHVGPAPHEMMRAGAMDLMHPGEGSLGEMDGGSAGEAVKVARNWSREETLSLVRAIKRHYEALKRCKTNQERSNVWHRIHKEHSSQFPGRSKKASQDRWGKVLSDYKDVMVHNKEKGAARWTFDFFKEVAAIVEGDSQLIDSAMSPPSSTATTASSAAGRPPTDDLSLYSFGAATAPPPPSVRPLPMARPPLAQHRMSEPNLKLLSRNDPRLMPQHRPPPPSLSVHGRNSTMAVPQQRPQLSPIDSAIDGRQMPPRYSPPRRTSFPQVQQLLSPQAAGRAGRGSYHTFRYYPQPAPPQSESENVLRCDGPLSKQMRVHSWAPSSAVPEPGIAEGTAGTRMESGPVSPDLASGNAEDTCRHVLDLLSQQMRRIDVEQDNLVRLKESTQSTINRVEQIMQMYIRPPPPPSAAAEKR